MSHLILTTNDLSAYRLQPTRLANQVVGFDLRLVPGMLPPEAELTTLVAPRSAKHDADGKHWLDHSCRAGVCRSTKRNDGLIEFCDRFDSIELWVDPQANDQLILVWLLDVLRPYKEVTSKLSLVQSDDRIANYRPDSLAAWKLPAFKMTDRHLALSSRAWQAYRAPTPEGCFELLLQDTTILPRLRPAMIALLEELPDSLNGLGVTEERMLEYLANGCTDPREVLYAANIREIFNEREAMDLFDELAQCPEPLVLGLGDIPFEKGEEARWVRYKNGKVALTELGQAVVEAEDDFCRHNPIRRWWGGAHLTNERLWRWDRERRSLVAP
ncbi:hypothetical protein [Bradyrhizobium sp. 186]|uniref:hypothetical protein n=1 Tax=Bradyrhizobium sp. 186 TaxID=2782654 RepID=UPI00200102E4|nr:hypothetical protein [Bradyrhizobium sp. 186]